MHPKKSKLFRTKIVQINVKTLQTFLWLGINIWNACQQQILINKNNSLYDKPIKW